MKKRHIAIMLSAVAAMSCSTKKELEPHDDVSPVVCEEVYIDSICADKWTYFSIEKGEVLGQSTLYDKQQDSVWFERTDWDIAFCEGRIKTNGGVSGKGQAKIQMNMSDKYESIIIAPESGYFEDEMSEY